MLMSPQNEAQGVPTYRSRLKISETKYSAYVYFVEHLRGSEIRWPWRLFWSQGRACRHSRDETRVGR